MEKDKTFSFDVPNQEEIKQEVEAMVKPSNKDELAITQAAQNNVDKIMEINLDSFEERKEYKDIVNSFGLEDMKSSQAQNAMLQKQIGALQAAGGENGEVAKGLTDLTLKMKDLDPSGIDFAKGGVLGKIFNPVRRYFEKFHSADDEIAAIVDSLEKGKKTLTDDNITLELEETNMRGITKKMQNNIMMGQKFDEYLVAGIEKARANGEDPEKIRFIEEEILYPLRQRIEDFQQVQTVDQQGIIAIEIIKRNNHELIRSVERAQTVTVSALRTAVTVASALYNQKIVLEKVTTLNEVTNNMLASTSKMLHEQGVAIQKQASEASITPETLRTAFNETLSALEDISKYRQEALPKMKETINVFNELAEEGERRIQNMEKTGLL